MSTINGGGITVTKDLLVHLDAANNKSVFPTWGDLTINGYNATLNNFTGQYFTTNNAGEINFNGTNTYISIPNIIRTGVGFVGTIEVVTSSFGPMVFNERTSNGCGDGYFSVTSDRRLYVGLNGSSFLPYTFGSTSTIAGIQNSFNYYAASYQVPNSSGTMSGVFCINGVFENFSNSVAIDTIVSFTNIDIGRQRNFIYPPISFCSSGATAIVRIYTRRLTNAEMLQNYNVTKSRFNLI